MDGDVVRLALGWLLSSNDELINVHHLVVDDSGGFSDDEDFMVQVANWFETVVYDNVLPYIANTLIATFVTGKNVTQDYLLPDTPWSADGEEAATEIIPPQCAPLIWLGTPAPRVQCRNFLPMYTEAYNANGVIQSTALAATGNFALDLLAGFVATGIDVQRVAYNRVASTFERPTAAFVGTTFRTQRRRRRGVGS